MMTVISEERQNRELALAKAHLPASVDFCRELYHRDEYTHLILLIFLFTFEALVIEPGALRMLGRCSVIEICSQHNSYAFNLTDTYEEFV